MRYDQCKRDIEVDFGQQKEDHGLGLGVDCSIECSRQDKEKNADTNNEERNAISSLLVNRIGHGELRNQKDNVQHPHEHILCVSLVLLRGRIDRVDHLGTLQKRRPHLGSNHCANSGNHVVSAVVKAE